MNMLITEELPAVRAERDLLWQMIDDHDLAYKLPGANPTLGELCADMGYTLQVYIHSYTTGAMDWDHRASTPEQPLTVASLRAWFAPLDAQLHDVLDQYSDEEIHSVLVDRGHGFTPSVFVQYQVLREALLIFYAKASVYLKALDKPFSDQWKAWIG